MTEKLQKRLNDSAAARWGALIIVSFTMMCGYFITDVMAPLEDLLTKLPSEGGLGWTSDDYGFFSGAYGYINVFLLMLFFGGIILDKCGIRFTGVASSGLMLLGTIIKWYALKSDFGADVQLFGMPMQVVLASLGFAVFGMGAEITCITVTKVIAKWFTGHELALAMGLQVAMARIGTAAALACSLPLAQKMGSVAAPVLLGAALLCVGFLAYLVYCVMDRKLDASATADQTTTEEEEGFHFSDLKLIFSNKGFWLIAILCVLFYSGVFPFLKFATKLMIYKYGVEPELAGLIPAMLPFGTILLTPVFGSLYDRLGKGATLMIIGSAMLTLVHVLFALPLLNVWWFAILIMIVLGIAFSLVPSAMWPSVPKIIPMRQLGSAYAIIFYIQNIGLSMVPLLIGSVIEKYATKVTAEGVTYDYTVPMSIFAVFGVIAIIVAVILKRADKTENYGLEKPNIE
ncbi:MAG: MFS transporter [Rikenellaceae bacterium]|nr:MFS transporter [Rikenellaceae bacterium]